MVFRLPALAALLSTILVAGCQGDPVRPASAPVPPPAPAPAPPPAPVSADWRDRPLDAGGWRYEAGSPLSFARYGAPGATEFALRCDATARQVTLMRSGAATEMVITTSSRTARFPAGAIQDQGKPMSAVILNAADSFLDAMAFSRGRVKIASAGLPDIIVPSWAEITRAIEDCRK